MSEECHKPKLEEACKAPCIKHLLNYQVRSKDIEACEERIKSDETGSAHCTGQFFDYWSCVDKCVAKKLFDRLK